MKDKILALLKPQATPDVKLSVISLFLAKCMEMYEARIIKLEARQLQKGDTGEKGLDGKNGVDGKNGKDGKNGIDGKNGKDGKDGKDGVKGKNGISVIEAEIDVDDHLVLKLSDGSIIDCGVVNVTKNIYVTQATTSTETRISDFVQSNAFQNNAFQ